MQTNEIPTAEPTDNETGCCARFHPERWDNQTLHFLNKPFVRASTTSVFHVPLNMGSVFTRTWKTIKDAGAEPQVHFVMSHEQSPWKAEHLFAVEKDVPGAEVVRVSGDFVTKVFEGPFSDAAKWCGEMAREAQAKGQQLDTTYLFYTTCPRCAKHYGKNYVVAVGKVLRPSADSGS